MGILPPGSAYYRVTQEMLIHLRFVLQLNRMGKKFRTRQTQFLGIITVWQKAVVPGVGRGRRSVEMANKIQNKYVSVNNTTLYFMYNKNSIMSGRNVSTFIRSSSGPL